MSTVRFLLFIAASAFACKINAQNVEVMYFDDVRNLAVEAAAANTDGGSARSLTFNSFGTDFELELEPNARINRIARRLGADSTLAVYRGTLRGNPDSWVRLVFSTNGPAGLVWNGTTLYGIESPTDNVTGSAQTSIFRMDDIYFGAETMSCATGGGSTSGADAFERLVSETASSAALTATLNLDMGVVSDFEFSSANSADPVAALITRMNNVDGIFSEQVGVRITLTDIEFFDTDTDPFTQDNAVDLLDELRTFRGNQPQQRASGLTHLFTGRPLSGTTVGIAYFGAVCSTEFGAGLTEARHGPAIDSLIAAHEIGHNFGAPHDGDPNQGCGSTPETFLMASNITGSDQFSACSRQRMQAEIAAATCLSRLSFADVELMAAVVNPSVLAGPEFDYVLSVINQGSEAAAASIDISFDTGLNVLDAVVGSGSCDPPQSKMSCRIEDLPGGGSRDISIRLRSEFVGAHNISAAAIAAGDVDLANNVIVDIIDVVPAVDLALAAQGPVSAPINISSDVVVTVSNLSGLPASAVNIAVTAAAELQLNSGMLGTEECSISSPQSLVCTADGLRDRGNVALTLSLAGTAAGTSPLTLSAAATEAEINPADNRLVLLIDIVSLSAPPQGGGGSTSLITILSLSALALSKRWRQSRRLDKHPPRKSSTWRRQSDRNAGCH